MTKRHRPFDEWLAVGLAALGVAINCAIFTASWPVDMHHPHHRHAQQVAAK